GRCLDIRSRPLIRFRRNRVRRLPATLTWICFLLAVVPVSWAAEKEYTPAERSHWSLQKRIRPALPQFADPADVAWIRNPIDALILARLKQQGLRPAAEADRRTLLRRLSYDLTGLPPSPAEIQQFVADPSPLAYEELGERLLASPHYG